MPNINDYEWGNLKKAEKEKYALLLNRDEEKELRTYGYVEVDRYGFTFLVESLGNEEYVISMMCPYNKVMFQSQKVFKNKIIESKKRRG